MMHIGFCWLSELIASAGFDYISSLGRNAQSEFRPIDKILAADGNAPGPFFIPNVFWLWPWIFPYIVFFMPKKGDIDIKKANLFITKLFISINERGPTPSPPADSISAL